MLFIRTEFFEIPSLQMKDNEEIAAMQWIVDTLVVYLTIAFTFSVLHFCIRPQQCRTCCYKILASFTICYSCALVNFSKENHSKPTRADSSGYLGRVAESEQKISIISNHPYLTLRRTGFTAENQTPDLSIKSDVLSIYTKTKQCRDGTL